MGGDAILTALLGENRWGALPFTMYTNAIVSRSYYRPEDARLRAHGGITHMYYDGALGPPVFPFGFGLSYTTFAYSWADGAEPEAQGPVLLRAGATNDLAAPLVSYRVNVTNTGSVAGDAVVLAIVEGPSPDYPLERLFNFARVRLEPGQSQEVSFVASQLDLSAVAEDGSRWLRPGTALRVRLGDRVAAALSHKILLEGDEALQLPVFPGPGGYKSLRGNNKRR
jgi:hypothetical protein